jgi:DNA polymerase-3 subunit beta
MKFSVSSSELLKQLQLAAGAISSNPVIPIMENFLFTVDNKMLTIAATDLETSITTSIEVMADENFSVAVPAKILLETLKALPQQPITFVVNEASYGLEITSSYGKYKLAGEKGTDYPNIPEPDTVQTVKINSQYLLEAINKTVFAASGDDLRPAMTGVFFEVENNKLTCVATDAHKLVRYTTYRLTGEVSTSFIAPRKALNLLKAALPQNDAVTIAFNKSNAFFSFGAMNLVCRLIDARYPDYNAVIPVENPNNMTTNRSDFQNSLRRIAIYSNRTTNQVALDINDKSLTISAQDLDFSNEATEQLSCTHEGEPLRIAFNAKFLVEMLGVLDGDEIKMEFSTASRPGIITPVEETNADRDILMLVMPVMLNN